MSDIRVRVGDAVDAYLQRKAVGSDPDGPGAGTYASNAESILDRWATWLETEHGVQSLFDLEVDHLEAYASELAARTDRGEYTASTAGTYYAVVRAFLSWCVHGGILEENPAATAVAESALPTEHRSGGSSTDSTWTAEQRRTLEAFVRDRAARAESGDRDERLARLRECAMVALLAHSGVRGSELFRVPEDDRRTGATWEDVDFYSGTIRVLGKSQRLEDVPLPAAARKPLRRYRVVQDPPTTEWPLFPTRHAPSVAQRVRSVLAERGFDDEAIEAECADHTAAELARRYAIAPPTITTEGARSILKRLCDEADIDVGSDYLTPRGARPGLGKRTYPSEHGAGTGTGPETGTTETALREHTLEQSIAVVEESPFTGDVDAGGGAVGDESAGDEEETADD